MLKNTLVKNIVYAGSSAIVLVLLILWFLRVYTNHGEKMETPNFNGLTIEEGLKLAEENDLTLIIDTVFNSSAKKGTIFLQSPSAHEDSIPSYIKPGRKIYITAVRNSIQLLPFPNIDASELIVIPRLSGRFKVKKEYIPGPSGKVMYATYNGKKIAKDDLIPRNAKVTIFVGQDLQKIPVPLPNLIGLTASEANAQLTNNGLSLVEVYNNCVTPEDSLKAKIFEQTPQYYEGGLVLQGTGIVVILNCSN